MADKTLRSYVREIDNLIEQEKLDEAIAHSRHILQSYPKYIECYRLLGKAYLEAKRYGDAADIFQRVLSAVPDDFVSHIGMSIVREDEGNLDSAIWHMERAFETNPANPAIQQELKRLIGRREGFEPHKVRLTRGALARMYAHGELYPQAIAELRSALQEDSERPDLQVLLADMYWQTDERVEAAEVSSQILEKLPYCLQAVRIMAAVLQDRGKEQEATKYHRRLAQLNPYMAYIESPMAEPTRVEADTIRLERLSWQPGQPLPAGETEDTEWAAALGLEVEEDSTQPETSGPLPSWLEDVEPEGAEETPSFEMSLEDETPDVPSPEEEPEEEIPEWMSEAGWEQASGETEERPVSFSSEELDALERGELPTASAPAESPEMSAEGAPSDEEDQLEPAEIPSWLQGMAPEDEADIDDEPETEEDEELVSWLTGEQDEADEEPIAEAAEPDDLEADLSPEAAEPEATDEAADVPGWLDEGEPGATSTIMSWLGDRDSEEQMPAEELPQASGQEAAEQEPSFAEPTAQPEEEGEDEVPGWLSGVAEAAADTSSSDEEELAQFRQQAEAGSSEPYEEPADEAGEDAIPAWLQDIADEEAEEPAAEQQPPEAPKPAEPESWEAGVEAAEQETIPQASSEEEQKEPPAWLRSFGEEPSQAPDEEPAAEAEPAASEAVPELDTEAEDWLADLGAEPGGEELDEEAAAWLSQLGEDEEEEPAPTTAGEPEEVPDWMRGLEEEEPAGSDVDDLASDWLSDLSDTLAETPAEPEAEIEEGEPADWLEDMATEAEYEPAEDQPASQVDAEPEEEEDLEWLRSIEDSVSPPEPAQEQAAPTRGAQTDEPEPAGELEDLDEEGVFDWLDDMAARQEEAPEEIERIPDRESPAEPAEAEVSDAAPPESYEEGLDWLEELADRRGIDADVRREAQAPQEEQAPSAPERPAPPSEQPEPAVPEEPEPKTADAEAPSVGEEQPSLEAEEPPATQPGEPLEPELETSTPSAEEPERAPSPPVQPPSEEAPEPTHEEPAEITPEAAPSAEPDEEVPEWLAEHGEGVAIGDEAEQEPPAPEEPAEQEATAPEEPAPWQPSEPVGREPTPPQPTETPPPAEPAEVEAPTQPPRTEPAETAPPEPAAEQPPQEEQVEVSGLDAARQALADGDSESAAARYAELVEQRTSLEQVVEDLETALEDGADASTLWQTLGDAYMRLDRTKDAVKAYSRGLEKNEILENARQALASGDVERAAAHYSVLIKKKSSLEAVIDDLSHAVEEDGTPVLWQTLGDAYMKAGQLDDSIRAYRKGMDTV